MPKCKHSRHHRSPSGYSYHKEKRKYRQRSRSASSRDRRDEIRSRESPRSSSTLPPAGGIEGSSGDASPLQSFRLRLADALTCEIVTFLKRHGSSAATIIAGAETSVASEAAPPGSATDVLILPETEFSAIVSPEVEPETDGQTVLRNWDDAPAEQLAMPIPDRRVSFPEPAVTQEEPNPEEGKSSLVSELFGEEQYLVSDSSWDPVIFNATRSEIRTGLNEELRQSLLSKYELKGDLASLGPPKLNKELMSALFKRQAIIKRDKYLAKQQIQVGTCVNILGSAIADLIKFRHSLPQDDSIRNIIAKLAEGLHLLADLQFRFSLARQTYIKPCPTFVGKSVADSAQVDDWLFGSHFVEELKAAQACEKSGRELSRPTPAPSSTVKMSNQPTCQLPNQPKSSNFKAPVQHRPSSARRTGATQSASRSHYHRSRSRPLRYR
ncbi:hypothetical protein DMN91_010175 [Ooceraea biroi]|uniref:Uncharacterized protein n=1 Tax=Ooceraea biroi TaxID=2015173 RepID=A0A3L8DCA1_OOCBI|nr:uncharacterized protein LOC105282188 [Ooceraea biroi]RLU17936.1 hypothetical protein DMN91_010175 [Ooceraea biroi]